MQKGFRPRLPPTAGRGLGLLGHAPAGFNPINNPGGQFPNSNNQQGNSHPPNHPMPPMPNPYIIQQGQFSTPPPGFNVQGESNMSNMSTMNSINNMTNMSSMNSMNNMSSMGNIMQQNGPPTQNVPPVANPNVPPPSLPLLQQQGSTGTPMMPSSAASMMSTPPPMMNPNHMVQGCNAPPSGGGSVHPDRDSQLALVSNLLKGLTNSTMGCNNNLVNGNMNTNNGNSNIMSNTNNNMSANNMMPTQPPPPLPPPMMRNNMNTSMNNSMNLSNNMPNNLGSFSPSTPPPNSGLLGMPKQPLLSLPGSGPNMGLLGHTPFDLQNKPPSHLGSQGLLSTPSGGNQSNRRGHYGNGTHKEVRNYHGNHDRSRSLDRTPPGNRNKNNSLESFENRNSFDLRSFNDIRSHSSSSSNFHKDSLATAVAFASLATSVSSSASTTSQDHSSVSDEGQEEYDPAEPTGENAIEDAQLALLCDPILNNRHSNASMPAKSTVVPSRGALKRPRSPSPSNIHVTLLGKGRHVHENGPSSVKKEREMSPRGSLFPENLLDKPNYCHACSVDCLNPKGFEQHMSSPMHQARMQEMINMHMRKTDQQLARMKAEEHLRKIEGKAKEDYCRICDKRFPGTFVQHRRTQEHRRKERLTKRGCKLCDTGSYQQYPDYVKHIDSESHKKKKEELRRQGSHPADTDKSSSIDEDRESFADVDSIQDADSSADVDSFPDDLEELVTVDATGIYNEEEHDMEGFDEEEGLKKAKDSFGVTLPTVAANYQHQVMQLPTNEQNAVVNEISFAKDGSDKENKKELANTVEASLQFPLGQEFVIPISGFFCKLCHKFFTKESTATSVHCLSPSHQIKYQKVQELRKQKENGRTSETLSAIDNATLKSNSTGSRHHETSQGDKKSSQKDLCVQLVDIKDILETNNNNKSNALLLEGEEVHGAVKKSGVGVNQSVSQVRKRVAFNHKNRIIIIRKQVDDDNEAEVEMDSCLDDGHQEAPEDSVTMVSNGQSLLNGPNGMEGGENADQDIFIKISPEAGSEMDKTVIQRNKPRRSERAK